MLVLKYENALRRVSLQSGDVVCFDTHFNSLHFFRTGDRVQKDGTIFRDTRLIKRLYICKPFSTLPMNEYRFGKLSFPGEEEICELVGIMAATAGLVAGNDDRGFPRADLLNVSPAEHLNWFVFLTPIEMKRVKEKIEIYKSAWKEEVTGGLRVITVEK